VEALELYVEQRTRVLLLVGDLCNRGRLLELLLNMHPDAIAETINIWSEMKLNATNDQSTASILV